VAGGGTLGVVEAILLTVILAILIVAALALLARTWPRSSPLTGFRIRDHDAPPRPVREDDDAPSWHLPPQGGPEGRDPPPPDHDRP
jgi:hypothetical protein